MLSVKGVLVVVLGAADVVVARMADAGIGVVIGQRQAILPAAEDVLDRLEAERAQSLGPFAGGLESLVSVGPAEPHQPKTGAITLLGVRPATKHLGDEANNFGT